VNAKESHAAALRRAGLGHDPSDEMQEGDPAYMTLYVYDAGDSDEEDYDGAKCVGESDQAATITEMLATLVAEHSLVEAARTRTQSE
jgi:hypothetical protein